MDILEFVSKVSPRKLTVETEEIIKQYGEPLEFYIMMPMPIEKYAKALTLSKAEFVKDMLVTKDGQQLIKDSQSIDGVFISDIHDRIWVELGKLPGRTSQQS